MEGDRRRSGTTAATAGLGGQSVVMDPTRSASSRTPRGPHLRGGGVLSAESIHPVVLVFGGRENALDPYNPSRSDSHGGCERARPFEICAERFS